MTVSPTRSRTSARAAAAALAAAVAIGAGLLSAPAAIAAPAAAPASAPAADHHSLTSTVSAGKGARDIAFDRADNRVYVPVDRGSGTPGAITWLDGTTGEPSGRFIELADAEPQTLVVDASAHALYVLHYRTGTLTVIDTDTNAVTKVVPGLPLFPGGMELDTVTGDLYVSDDGIITVDPRAGTVSAEVAISTQRFPRITDMVYDAANRLLWISEGRSGVITAFSSVTKTWMNTVSTPIATFQVNGEPIGGGPKSLAIDEQLGHLYVGVDPSFVDDWEDTKLVTIDTTTARFRGAPIDLGDTTRELAVNPSTHEVYASNGFSNTLSVVSPATWSVAQTIDFTALGVTNGTGAGDADIWGLAANAAGDRVFISHPYTARVSVIDRTGSADAVTELPYSPGQGTVDPQPPTSEVWPGPAGATLAPAPADAIATTAQSLSWSVSDYARAWTGDLYGAVTKGDEDRYTFTGGTGWSSPSTGETQLTWNDGFRLRPYPVLAPQVKMTFGNPLLTAAADGSGTLSFDVAWEVSDTDVSNGFTRVDVATFAAGAIQVSGENVSVTTQPEFEGRPFTDEDGEVSASSYPASFLTYLDPQIRGWWYTTGASLDKNKHPNPVSLTFTRATAPTGPTDPTSPTDPGTTPGTPGNPGTPGTPGASNGNGNSNGTANGAGTSADPASALVSTGASLTGGVAGLALLLLGGLFLLRRRATARTATATPAAPTATTATAGE
ncbi:HtaA domain-containing protein [Plantibacter sp. YIM 135347]|uniref:HtaA domain-containing protein n=1 Tax=Plantibacter sp. YIM 135347 TaxID=3423919 RepID=UPI003D336712